jgi:hypothetical protein
VQEEALVAVWVGWRNHDVVEVGEKVLVRAVAVAEAVAMP